MRRLCEPGSYCPEGASAALLCAEGSYSEAADLGSDEQCTKTDPGYYASTGSTEQTPCSPGTVATNASMGACAKCEAGKYQDTDGKTECKPCTVGSYCAEGAAAPLPCKAGTYQNETMLQLNLSMTSADDCLECPTGHRCVGGQSEPKLCAAWAASPPSRALRGAPSAKPGAFKMSRAPPCARLAVLPRIAPARA